MNVKKWLAGTVAASMLTGAAVFAAAGPAAASDEGTLLPGGIYWFNAVGALSTQTAATQITSGTNAANGGNLGTGRPWATLSTENACPATAVGLYSYIRIPQTGVPENDWAQVQVGTAATAKDADGRFYTTTILMADRLNKSEIMTYLATAPANTGTLPFVSVCRDAGGNSVGYFRTMITMSGTTQANLTWSIPSVALPMPASTTTLAASAASVELGASVELTATVTPASATGSVEFFAGATSLGTAVVASGTATLSTSAIPVGANSITAQYLGGSNAASASAPAEITVTPLEGWGMTSTTLVVSPVSGPAYSPVTLTATVTSAMGPPNGAVEFYVGGALIATMPVTAGVVPTFTTNGLGPTQAGYGCPPIAGYVLIARFVAAPPYLDSVSAPVQPSYPLSGLCGDEQVVTVEIPPGLIEITTPYTPAAPLALGVATLDPADSTYSASAPFSGIVITDSRAGNLGFTASVVSGAFVGATGSFPGIHAGLTGLIATQVVGNALQATNVVLTDRAPFVDGLGVPKVFAQYAAGQTIGTAHLEGVFGVDQVPTSVAPGLYTATVTFTAI